MPNADTIQMSLYSARFVCGESIHKTILWVPVIGFPWFSPPLHKNSMPTLLVEPLYQAEWGCVPCPGQLAPYLNSVDRSGRPEGSVLIYRWLDGQDDRCCKHQGFGLQLCGEGRCDDALELARQTLEHAEKHARTIRYTCKPRQI